MCTNTLRFLNLDIYCQSLGRSRNIMKIFVEIKTKRKTETNTVVDVMIMSLPRLTESSIGDIYSAEMYFVVRCQKESFFV